MFHNIISNIFAIFKCKTSIDNSSTPKMRCSYSILLFIHL